MKIPSYLLMGAILLLGLSLYALVWCASAGCEAWVRLWSGAPVNLEVRYAADDPSAARAARERFGLERTHRQGFSLRPLPAGRTSGWTRARHVRRVYRAAGVLQVTQLERLGYLDAVSSRVGRVFSLGA